MSLKVLVTGGAGFIGSHLVEELIRQQYDVSVVDNLSSGSRSLLPKVCHFYRLDVRSSRLKTLLRKIKPDYVCHLAAQISAPQSMADAYADADINIMGSLNLLEALRGLSLQKFLFVSTAGVYGQARVIPTDEQAALLPPTPYALAKLTVENYLRYYEATQGIKTVVLRLSNVYGPRQGIKGEGGVVAIFARRLLKGETLIIDGQGEQTRDLIFVSDVVGGVVAALRHGRGLYNLSTQMEISVRQLVRQLGEVSGLVPQVSYGPARLGDIEKSCLANARAREDLSWQPAVPLSEGLRRTLLWLKQKDK